MKKRVQYLMRVTGLIPAIYAILSMLLICSRGSAQGLEPEVRKIFERAHAFPEAERQDFIDREMQKFRTKKRIREYTEKVEAEYTPVFAKLGVPLNEVTKLKAARVDLLRLAIDDGDFRQLFLSKRSDYDNAVRAALSPERHALLQEHPLTKRTPHGIDQSLWSEERDPEYAMLYAKWELDTETVASLLDKRRELRALVSTLPERRQNLIQGRTDYIAHIRNAVDTKAFSEYQNWELNKSPERVFQDLLTQDNPVPEAEFKEYRSALVNLLREAEINMSESWDGPFDPLPRPVVGRRLVAADARRRLERFQEARTRFQAMADFHSFPDAVLAHLDRRFDRWQNQLQNAIMRGTESDEEHRNRIFRKIRDARGPVVPR